MTTPALSFEFATATRSVFDAGRLREAGGIAASVGAHALVVESGRGRADALIALLHEHGVATTTFHALGEPTISLVEEGACVARDAHCDLVIALDGGSVIDAGKAIAALVMNRAPVRDYLEVVGRAQPLTQRPLPFIAIPTTAGPAAAAPSAVPNYRRPLPRAAVVLSTNTIPSNSAGADTRMR